MKILVRFGDAESEDRSRLWRCVADMNIMDEVYTTTQTENDLLTYQICEKRARLSGAKAGCSQHEGGLYAQSAVTAMHGFKGT